MNQPPRISPSFGGNFRRWALIGGVLLFLAVILFPRPSVRMDLEISEVVRMAEDGQIAEIEVRGDKLNVITTDGQTFSSRKESSVSLLELLAARGIATGGDGIKIDVMEESRSLFSIFLSLLPLIIFGGLIIWMVGRARGGMGQVMKIGKSKARMVVDKPSVTFNDVAGVDEAKQELAEIVEILKYPQKFANLGAKIPRGVLLVGPPGTGKTLLGRAVAGEAGVSFFSISGSEFVEMFVGVGASRVRDLFERAKASQPAIVFIDEIDAVGRHRGAGIGGGNDEREQTLNQILVQMDGFDERTTSLSSPLPTGPMFWTPLCCGLGGSTGGLWWACPMSSAGRPSSMCICGGNRSSRTWTCKHWHGKPMASVAPIWRTW